MDRDNENIGRATPISRNYMNPSRASRLDYDPMDEEMPDGQVSAREPLQNRDMYSKESIMDNREKTQFAKQTMALRKMTQTPVDKVKIKVCFLTGDDEIKNSKLNIH